MNRITKFVLLLAILIPALSSAQNRVGINIDTPQVELDVRPVGDNAPGLINVATRDQAYFARLFSGFGPAPGASLTWSHGRDFLLGRVNPDGTDFALSTFFGGDGRVGIGTYNPMAKLDIEAIGDGVDVLRFGIERPWYIRQYGTAADTRLALQSEVNHKAFDILAPAGGRVASFFVADNIGRVLLVPDTTGEVGIGVKDPTAKLQISVNSNLTTPQLELTEEGDDYARLKFTSTANPGTRWTIAGQADTIMSSSRLNFYYNGPEGFGDRMTIKGDGKVGIGTFNPTARLHVGGDLRVSDLAGAGDRNVIVDSNGKFKIGSIGSGGADTDWVETPDEIYNTTHNIGIGTSNPNSTLTIVGAQSNGTQGSLKMIYGGTAPLYADARSMIMDADDIDVTGTIWNTLNLQRNSAGGIRMVQGGGGVGIGGPASADLKLSVTGPRIYGQGLPEDSEATISIWNTDGDISQMIIDANEISTVDEDLHLNQLSSKNVVMVKGGGKVGVNTTNLSSTMNIEGLDNDGSVGALQIVSSGGQKMLLDGNEIDVTGTGNALYLNWNTKLPVTVGTNTLASGYMLNVAGKIIAEEVRVQLEGSWPDYVFKDEYELTSLDDLSEEIKVLGHLPGIPAAHTIEAEGLEVGDMQKRMMEKIEELTLHMIQMNERMKTLESENAALRAQIEK